MRLHTFIATAFLAALGCAVLGAAVPGIVAAASAAPAHPGCRHGNGLGSDNASTGINANTPSRANMNPCSPLYHNGVNVRRMEKRRYPNAVVHH